MTTYNESRNAVIVIKHPHNLEQVRILIIT